MNAQTCGACGGTGVSPDFYLNFVGEIGPCKKCGGYGVLRSGEPDSCIETEPPAHSLSPIPVRIPSRPKAAEVIGLQQAIEGLAIMMARKRIIELPWDQEIARAMLDLQSVLNHWNPPA